LLTGQLGNAGTREEAPGVALGATAVAGWVVLIVVAHVWGRHLIDTGHRLQLGRRGFPPLVGEPDWRLGLRALPALALAGLALAAGPRLAARLPWRRLLAAVLLAAAAWAVSLAVVDPGGLTRPLLLRGEYLHNVADVGGSPLSFLRSFTDRLGGYHTHVQGHPPGMLLLLWALGRLGLGGAGWAAAMVIAGGAVAAPASLLALRAVGGEVRARAAAPFLALAPAAVWVATTADALYMGVTAAAVALLARAGTRPPGRQATLAAGSGLLFGAGLLLSYGAVLLAPVAGGVALAQRRWRPLVMAAGVALGVLAVAWAAGFLWPAGLAATRLRYLDGVSQRRPYGFFLLANLAALALVVGPAVPAALARLRHRGVWLLTGGALIAVALADLSGLSKGEVERIWLPFVPWLLAATCSLRHGAARFWLGLQLLAGLVVQLAVRTPW
jgi:hypothetical protein